ncbi:MAG: KUP/HAK/KT family potassium transporter [Prevotella sp.]|nr:KUP/HAK/KT family potassium transporter [Bacteroides sp.]MCM1367040.1 KUP/HAK/KT family potassium transporter [Prevotella sp.]MCM1437536.1 KUP/HAK/KT family potassium transporter [Prevotella sp.]
MVQEKKGLLHVLSITGVIVAVGIVFGDIGTSPLYVMKAIMSINPMYDSDYVIGAISCVIWTLTIQATVKYVLIALHADNNGEGGILALYSLLRKCSHKWLYLAGALGAAALIADGMLTPAITVSSAVEGIGIIAPHLPVMPIVVSIIILIFIMQKMGTSIIGRLFGPVMLLWFLTLGTLGVFSLINCPHILYAFNPWYAVKLLVSSPKWFIIVGAVFLCVTGAEALYSDLGHCGKRNITYGWFFVKTMLILNYLGQGAYLISSHRAVTMNPFYAIVPNSLVAPMIILSTLAAIIASQALLSGAFTIFSQAISLNFWPNLKIKYPTLERGQLYIPSVNWCLMGGCLATVFIFRDSSHLEAAYGLSITITMLMTTILLFFWLNLKGLGKAICFSVTGFFLVLEGLFFISNLSKFAHGGWYSLFVAIAIGIIMVVWYRACILRSSYIEFFPINEKLPLINDIIHDSEIPLYASNIVFLSRFSDTGKIESKLLYSIVNKNPKRADHYWLLHIEYSDSPYTLEYEVETILDNRIFAITFYLGYRVNPQINVFLRQVVEDLVKTGKLSLTSQYPSLHKYGIPGDFRFVILHRVFSASSNCRPVERFILKAYDRLRWLSLTEKDNFGLDTSNVTEETIPLILSTAPKQRILPRLYKP